ncbi:hypothetical protein U9M48_016227, partial [Paspalum notatum var. saurae]
PEKPVARRLAAVLGPNVSSSLPVTRKTLNPLPLSVWNSHCTAGMPGQTPLLAQVLNAAGSYGLHARTPAGLIDRSIIRSWVGVVGEAGVVDVEDPGVEPVGGGRVVVDLGGVGGGLARDGGHVPVVLAPGHVGGDVGDALRRHGAPALGVVGLHHDAPGEAVGVVAAAAPEPRWRPLGDVAQQRGHY